MTERRGRPIRAPRPDGRPRLNSAFYRVMAANPARRVPYLVGAS